MHFNLRLRIADSRSLMYVRFGREFHNDLVAWQQFRLG